MRGRFYAISSCILISSFVFGFAEKSSAQSPFTIPTYGFQCGTTNPWVGEAPRPAAQAQATTPDFHTVVSPEALNATFDAIQSEVFRRCAAMGRPNNAASVLIQLFASNYLGGRGLLVGAWRSPAGGAWRLTGNYIPTAVQKEQQAVQQKRLQEDAVAKRAQDLIDATALSKKLQSEFVTQNGVQMWVSPQVLKANPFPYKGKIVAMVLPFQQMVGDGEAIFGGSFDLDAYGVPNTSFTRPGMMAAIAVQIDGLKQIKMLGTDMAVPYGGYKGSYICKTQNCAEFFAPPKN